jgi:hypothetical protein
VAPGGCRDLGGARYLQFVTGRELARQDRSAISRDALVFIACFSSHSAAWQRGYPDEELLLAIDQLRMRQPDESWLVPPASTIAMPRL